MLWRYRGYLKAHEKDVMDNSLTWMLLMPLKLIVWWMECQLSFELLKPGRDKRFGEYTNKLINRVNTKNYNFIGQDAFLDEMIINCNVFSSHMNEKVVSTWKRIWRQLIAKAMSGWVIIKYYKEPTVWWKRWGWEKGRWESKLADGQSEIGVLENLKSCMP